MSVDEKELSRILKDEGPQRTLDVEVGRRLYHVKTLRPSWYRHPVFCFYEPSPWHVNQGHILYTWDENSCNAMMYANGVDDSDGVAKPLPFFYEELGACRDVIEKIVASEGLLAIDKGEASIILPDGLVWVGKSEDVAEAICLAFVKAFPVIDDEVTT